MLYDLIAEFFGGPNVLNVIGLCRLRYIEYAAGRSGGKSNGVLVEVERVFPADSGSVRLIIRDTAQFAVRELEHHSSAIDDECLRQFGIIPSNLFEIHIGARAIEAYEAEVASCSEKNVNSAVVGECLESAKSLAR